MDNLDNFKITEITRVECIGDDFLVNENLSNHMNIVLKTLNKKNLQTFVNDLQNSVKTKDTSVIIGLWKDNMGEFQLDTYVNFGDYNGKKNYTCLLSIKGNFLPLERWLTVYEG